MPPADLAAHGDAAHHRLCFGPPLNGRDDLIRRLYPVLFHHHCDHH